NDENILEKLHKNAKYTMIELVNQVIVTDAADIKKEYYLGATVDRGTKSIIVMGSAEGGVEIEQVAKDNPEAILKVSVDPRLGLLDYQARNLAFGMKLGEHVRDFTKIARGLVQTLIDHDASLVEINPLALVEFKVPGSKFQVPMPSTSNLEPGTLNFRLMALDAKMVLD